MRLMRFSVSDRNATETRQNSEVWRNSISFYDLINEEDSKSTVNLNTSKKHKVICMKHRENEIEYVETRNQKRSSLFDD